jgi:hypothetical protein
MLRKCTCSRHDIAEKLLNNTHSLSQEQIACYIGSVGKIINGEEDKQKFSISSFK